MQTEPIVATSAEAKGVLEYEIDLNGELTTFNLLLLELTCGSTGVVFATFNDTTGTWVPIQIPQYLEEDEAAMRLFVNELHEQLGVELLRLPDTTRH